MAVAGLVLGIISVICIFIPVIGLIGPIFGIIGIILSAVASKKAKNMGMKDGLATAGLVLSIVGTLLSALVQFGCLVFLAAMSELEV